MHGKQKPTLVHSMTWLMSSLLYGKSSRTAHWLELSMLGCGALPASTGIDHEPCWMPAVMWLGPAYALVVARSMSKARAGLSKA
jgi:hypothetical protein